MHLSTIIENFVSLKGDKLRIGINNIRQNPLQATISSMQTPGEIELLEHVKGQMISIFSGIYFAIKRYRAMMHACNNY